jgi:hypothetical protein
MPSKINMFPREILFLIRYHFSTAEQVKFTRVCHQWQDDYHGFIRDINYKKGDALTLSHRFINLSRLTSSALWRIDVNSLRSYTALTSLDLVSDRTVNSSTLRELTNLCKLRLQNNTHICDYGLEGLNQLVSLDLSHNQTIHGTVLLNLTSLKRLSLNRNDTIGEEVLEKLTSLEKLSLIGNWRISDSGLSRLTNLTKLRVRNNYISDSGISTLTSLTYLDATDSQRFKGKCLNSFSRLTTLRLYEGYSLEGEEGIKPFSLYREIKKKLGF